MEHGQYIKVNNLQFYMYDPKQFWHKVPYGGYSLHDSNDWLTLAWSVDGDRGWR